MAAIDRGEALPPVEKPAREELTAAEEAALQEAQHNYNKAVFAQLPVILKQAYLDERPAAVRKAANGPLRSSTDRLGEIERPVGESLWLNPSERIALVAHVQDALDQLTVLDQISSSTLGDKSLSKKMGEQVAQLLTHQKTLEIRYQKVSQEANVLRTVGSERMHAETQQQLGKLVSELQQNNQTLVKTLRNHSPASQNMFKLQMERSALAQLFRKTLRELRLAPEAAGGDQAAFRACRLEHLWHLLHTEYTQRHAVAATLIRESASTRTIQELQQRVTDERQLMVHELQERTHVIQQLRDTIQEIHALTASEQQYAKKELKAHEAASRQESSLRQTDLERERDAASLQLVQEQQAHATIQDFLQRQFASLEHRIQEWMQKYEEDTERKASELEALKQRRTNDLDRFEELLARSEELEKFVEAHRAQVAQLNKDREIERARESAAIRIQAWYRRILRRRGGLRRKGGGKKKSAGKAKGGRKGK